jgi:DNA-binding IclR family transcriptional regulator
VPRNGDDESNMLERSLQVLQAFRPRGGALRLAQLVERTGLPKTTVHRLARQLTSLQLLEQVNGCYQLGLAVFELSELVPVKQRLREAALPFMQDLFVATQETIHLGVRDGLDVVYIEKIRGHRGVLLPSRVGGRLPLTCTGIGKALLAHSEPALIEDVLSRPLRRITDRSVTDPAQLAGELATIRSTGVSTERGEATANGACVAAPVLVGGQPIAALSIAVPIDSFQPVHLSAAVRTAALGLSRRLSPQLVG